MPTFKDVVVAIIFISLASALMIVAITPLENGAWAEGIRADYAAEYASTEGESESEGMPEIEGVPSALLMVLVVVASLLKITLLMGLPGIITMWVRRLISRFKDRPSARAAPS